MKSRLEKIGSVFANFVLVFFLICAVSASPIHAGSMAYGETGDEVGVNIPCPMMMQGHDDHGADNANMASDTIGDMSCCLVQAVDGVWRDAAPVRLTIPVSVEILSDLRSALGDPDVDLKPPRG